MSMTDQIHPARQPCGCPDITHQRDSGEPKTLHFLDCPRVKDALQAAALLAFATAGYPEHLAEKHSEQIAEAPGVV